jgi:hypothetical protein
MAGNGYQAYCLSQVFSAVKTMCRHTWYQYQSEVFDAVKRVAECKEAEYLQQLREAAVNRVVCADAAWSHRGCIANQCWWVLMTPSDSYIMLAVCLSKSRYRKGKEVFKGNYIGSSKGMESEAMERGVATLKSAGVLPFIVGWVCDKDSSVSKQLEENPDTGHIDIHFDPGHTHEEEC